MHEAVVQSRFQSEHDIKKQHMSGRLLDVESSFFAALARDSASEHNLRGL